MTRTELKNLARKRLEDAEALYGTGNYDACFYMCGYVVELALKEAKSYGVQTGSKQIRRKKVLTQKQQWCPRCDRYMETEQKQTKLGRRGKLVKIITTCRKCRTTLSSKTTSAVVVEQMEAEATAKETGGDEKTEEE
jgi:RNA polymerase subunit RPABC4/transcription elongation factor Spt4